MEDIYGGVYAADETTMSDFKGLNLRKNRGYRPDIEWAVSIFRARIESRFFNQIELLNKSPYYNGFASTALCCLLIDTFYQFEKGIKQAPRGEHSTYYIRFLRDNLGDIFDSDEKAERFYRDIRNGILHAAQTCNGSRLYADRRENKTSLRTLLTEDEKSTVITFVQGNSGPIRVDVEMLARRLYEYYDDYCGNVLNDSSVEANFVKKINHIRRNK